MLAYIFKFICLVVGSDYAYWWFQVVEGPCDSVIIADGAALSAYQYFENLRNFLVAVEELGLPAFQASDLEQVCLENL